MAKQKTYTEKDRKKFAIFMRNTRTEDILRRIASAFDIAAVEGTQGGKSLPEAIDYGLKTQNLEGYSVNGRFLSYPQAKIVFEMVRGGKYCEFPRPQPVSIFVPVPLRFKFPEPIHFEPSGSQTSEEYLRDYELRLQEN
jgi:hypothetical protein